MAEQQQLSLGTTQSALCPPMGWRDVAHTLCHSGGLAGNIGQKGLSGRLPKSPPCSICWGLSCVSYRCHCGGNGFAPLWRRLLPRVFPAALLAAAFPTSSAVARLARPLPPQPFLRRVFCRPRESLMFNVTMSYVSIMSPSSYASDLFVVVTVLVRVYPSSFYVPFGCN